MSLYAKNPKKEMKVEFVRHPSARSVVLGFSRDGHPRMCDKRLLMSKIDFHLLVNDKWVKSPRVCDLVSWVKKVGVWGYCNHLSRHHKEIHFWISKKAKRESVIEFIFHEIMHAGGIRSEDDACRLSGLCSLAVYELEHHIDKLLSFKGRQDGSEVLLCRQINGVQE